MFLFAISGEIEKSFKNRKMDAIIFFSFLHHFIAINAIFYGVSIDSLIKQRPDV